MVYHIVNKSIAEFVIFNNDDDFARMLLAIRYYQIDGKKVSLSQYIRSIQSAANRKKVKVAPNYNKNKLVEIIAYCLMPTHFHLMVKELKNNGVSKFISDTLNSYTRYFNLKHKRKGPLWERRSKKVLIKTDEQLLYVTRYIHLNPVTVYLVDKPETWNYSSYREYIGKVDDKEKICNYSGLLEIDPDDYKKYVEDGISYQRELAEIKKLKLD